MQARNRSGGQQRQQGDGKPGDPGTALPKYRPETKEWTIMIYFASDNPLAPEVVTQLKAIKEAGFHPQVNVIAQFDPETPSTPTHVFDVNLMNKLKYPGRANIGFAGNDPRVRNLVADKLWGNTPRDDKIREKIVQNLRGLKDSDGKRIVYKAPIPPAAMDAKLDPEDSLKEFLTFCRKNYPARHYALIILGHGVVVGNDIFLYAENVDDDTDRRSEVAQQRNDGNGVKRMPIRTDQAPRHFLRLTGLGELLNDFTKEIVKSKTRGVFEFIGFHSCSMSGIEVAYEIRNTAKYMLASQGPAYVGSWPYRQILIQIFNDLESVNFRDKDLIDPAGIIEQLQEPTRICEYIWGQKFSSRQRKLLTPYGGAAPASPVMAVPGNIYHDLKEVLNECLSDSKLLAFQPTGRGKPQAKPIGQALKWANRDFLQKVVFKKKLPPATVRPTLLGTIETIYDFCIYNSYDFQLAGYSYDMCLCDLTVLRDEPSGPTKPSVKATIVSGAIQNLSAQLVAALTDKSALELILLAHWDSQSYWSEQYTDLYDFCLCLKKRIGEPACPETEETATKMPAVASNANGLLAALCKACSDTIEVLKPVRHNDVPPGTNPAPKQPSHNSAAGLIICSEFVGPDYQYSHGLSVFFPWSDPDDGFFPNQYESYTFGKRLHGRKGSTTPVAAAGQLGWTEFLKAYLSATKRTPRTIKPGGRARQLLDLLQHISARIYNADGQLGGAAPDDGNAGEKGSSRDWAGDDCSCPSIKNFPGFNRDAKAAPDFPMSPTLTEHVKKDMF
jgi:hypothetical protein